MSPSFRPRSQLFLPPSSAAPRCLIKADATRRQRTPQSTRRGERARGARRIVRMRPGGPARARVLESAGRVEMRRLGSDSDTCRLGYLPTWILFDSDTCRLGFSLTQIIADSDTRRLGYSPTPIRVGRCVCVHACVCAWRSSVTARHEPLSLRPAGAAEGGRAWSRRRCPTTCRASTSASTCPRRCAASGSPHSCCFKDLSEELRGRVAFGVGAAGGAAEAGLGGW